MYPRLQIKIRNVITNTILCIYGVFCYNLKLDSSGRMLKIDSQVGFCQYCADSQAKFYRKI